ncbi:MAG TPA: hypothetical protein VK563_16390 [Puia sp.]|nr:hypothetical protein [Puia sp.]
MKFQLILLLFQGFAIRGDHQLQGFDRSVFYTVMASGKANEIDVQLSSLHWSSVPEKEAYEGALLMKKAGLAARPKDKLKLFRSGYTKLESSLAKDSTNGEYHFLRLTIQEHAPRIVNYRKDLEQDSQDIYRSFKSLSPVVQKAIRDYSKKSKILHLKDLNE